MRLDKQFEYWYYIEYKDPSIFDGIDGRWESEKLVSIIRDIVSEIDYKIFDYYLITCSKLSNNIITKAYNEYSIIFSLIEIKDLVYKEVSEHLQNILSTVVYYEKFELSEDVVRFIREIKKYDKGKIFE